jgi:hypothetical protein
MLDRSMLMIQAKKDTPGPPSWVFGVQLTAPLHENPNCWEAFNDCSWTEIRTPT